MDYDARSVENPAQVISLEERIEGLLWGQFVADAASLGAHWYYDLDKLATAYPEGVHGFEAPLPEHWHKGKESGDFTHYGDNGLFLLGNLVEENGFVLASYGQAWLDHMTPKSGYAGYADHATRDTAQFYENFPADQEYDYQQGSDDNETATTAILAPVVALYFKDEAKLLERIETLTRFRHDNEEAIAYNQAHALILRRLLLGGSIEASVDDVKRVMAKRGEVGVDVIARIQEATSLAGTPVVHATSNLGQGCPLPSSFPAALHAAKANGSSYEQSVLEIIRAGGDSAGRGAMVGSWIGAMHGPDAIPEAWKQKVKAYPELKEKIAALVALSTR